MALFTPGAAPPPPELVDYVLCVEMYRCTPTELDKQPYDRVMSHLFVRGVIKQVEEQNQKAAAKRRRKS